MTAKQRAARSKFKAVVKEASKLRKKNPKLTQAQAVKQAWAISYSKERSGKKIGYSKEREKIHKAATKEIKREKQKNPDRKKKELVSLAYQNAPFRAIGATKVKAKKSKRTSEMHTDTKSHNVNIRVMSGIGAIKKSAETLLKNQYGNLAARKLSESTKRGKRKIQKQMSEIAAKIKKVGSL